MIVTFASAWSASNGGINAFNFELSRALAKSTKQPLFCAVTDPSLEEIAFAEKDGVTLIKVKATPDGKPSPDCADNIIEALSGGNGAVQLWVGHDLISGDAAVRAASTHGGRLALVHHMDYLSYQNISGDRGDHTYDNYERQMKLFRTEEATLFGVGSWLTDNASRLGNRRAHCLVPGFPNISGSQHRVSTDRLMVVSAGRFDEKAEPLKQISTALDGFALALRHSTSFPMLQSATMSILGVDGTEDQKALHARAEELAGRPVNIVPAGFRNDPTAVARLASTSHLVVVPSRHEGFGLVGWEAIGTETPLIIGSNTGLAHLLRKTLDGREAGLVSIVKFDGSDQDRERISEAIQNVARDLSTALRRASTLRSHLTSELECTWDAAARSMLCAVGLTDQNQSAVVPPTQDRVATFREQADNRFQRCVELGASAAQGSTRQSVEVIAELRFGVSELVVDNIQAELTLKQATLELKPQTGKIAKGDRLGEGGRAMPGVEALSGGVWQIKPTGSSFLLRKVLGNEALCVVEASGEDPVVINLEVTAALKNIECDLQTKRNLSNNVKKIMGVFLKDCVYKPESGHVLFSSVILCEEI